MWGRADESAHVVSDSEFVPMREVLILIKGANVILVQSGRKITCRSTHEIFQVFDGVCFFDHSVFDTFVQLTEGRSCENLTTRHYKYLHKVRSALLASASNKNPKQTETSTNVTATLFTTTKEDTCMLM